MTRKVFARAVALAFALGLLTPGLAAAAKASSDTDYYSRVDARIQALEASGASPSAVDAMLEREFGWTRLNADATANTQSSGATVLSAPLCGAFSASDVTFNLPTAFWNAERLRYEARATWQWKLCNWQTGHGDIPRWSNYPNNGAGQDAFGLNIEKAVNRLSSSLIVYDETGAGTSFSVPDEFNSHGVGYREYDYQRYLSSKYTWDHGSIYMSFTLPSSSCVHGTAVVMDTKMGHTWQSTDVTGITIDITNISLTFSTTSYRWTGVSNPTYWYPCG